MDRHSCVLLDGIVLISMETITSVGDDFQLDGQLVCWWIDILQMENGLGRTDYWWIDILLMENGPGQ